MKKKTPSNSARAAASPAPAASGSPPRWQRLWPYLLLVALAVGIYANALDNGFVSDDSIQLLGNPLVTDWREVPDVFQHDIWAFTGHATSNFYRPIQIVLYMVLYHAFGFDPFVFHLGMVLVHAGNTLLVYSLGRRLLHSRYAALVAGILFAVHPIHNEPVVWIAVLPDVLMTMLVLASLILFLRWDAAPRGGQIAVLAGMFFLALLTKEPGAMLVPLLAGYEFLYLGRPAWPGGAPSDHAARRTLWQNWALYASLMGAFGVYALLRIHALGAMAPGQGLHQNVHGRVLILTIISTLGQYLGKLVLPIHLNFFHFFEVTSAVTPQVIVSLVVELGIIAAIIWLRASVDGGASSELRNARDAGNPGDTARIWSGPLISYGLFFILTPLAPALNVNGLGENVFAERYLYLPSVGFVMLAAMAWDWLASKKRELAWATVAVIVVASAWILLPRNLDWHDEERLVTVTAAASPKSARLVADLGTIHSRRGEFDAAIEKYQAALKMQPELADVHNNLGNVYGQQGRYQDAAAELRKAIELRPDYFEAYTDLAVVLMKQKDYPAAIDFLQRAIAMNPRSFEAYVDLGAAYNDTNRWQEGSVAFHNAIRVGRNHPGLYVAHYNLGLSYSHLNLLELAALEFSQALQMKPDFAAAQEDLTHVQNALQQPPAKKPF